MSITKLKWNIAQKLEYNWWQKYLKNKDPKQYIKWKTDYWNKLLSELSNHITLPLNKTVLDAGCGPAGIFLALHQNTVYAIDPLLDKYQNLPHFNVEKNDFVTFNCQTLESFSEVESYDYIFCLNAINHVREIDLCYDNLVKALKPGGIMVISTDAHKYSFLKRVFQLIPGDVLHPIQLEISEYDEFLLKRNMKVIKNINYEKGKIFDYYITLAKKE